jgi:integrase
MPKGTKHDGLYRRPKSPYWYFKLKQNGVWREHSTKCKKYNEAKGIKSRTAQDLENGMLPDSDCANSPFSEAVEAYLAAAALRLKLSSLRKERFFLVRPRRQLGSIRCQKVTPLNIRELQSSMKADGCSNSYVNLVVGAASRVLQFAKVWKRLAEDVLRLPESKVPIGRVLTESEKMKLFKTAESNPDWITAYSAGLIAVSTGMRGCELKHLKWGAVDLFSKVLEVKLLKHPLKSGEVHLETVTLRATSRRRLAVAQRIGVVRRADVLLCQMAGAGSMVASVPGRGQRKELNASDRP